MKLVLNMALIQTVIVVSDVITEKIVKVVNEDQYTATEYTDHIFNAKVIGDTLSIKKGCKGLIIQSGDNNDVCYYLGNIDEEEVKELKEKSIQKNVGNNSFSLDDKKMNVITDGTEIITKEDFYSISTSSKNKELFSNITGSKGNLNLFHKKQLLFESNDITHRIGNGNFIITGATDSEASEDSGEFDKYKSFNQFYVKARNINLDAEGGTYAISGNVFKTRLGSSALASFVPGTGSSKAFDVEVISGDIEFTIGLGSYYINVENFKFIDTIEFRVGTPLHPTASGHQMTAFKNKIYLDTLFPAVSSYIEMKTGAMMDIYSTNRINIDTDNNFNLTALMNINTKSTLKTNIESLLDTNIESTTMNVNIKSLMNTSIKATKDFKVSSLNTAIEAMVKAEVKAQMIKLQAQMQLDLEAQMINIKAGTMLDMSGSTMIEAGPKSVIPTGVGPFQAIKVCPFAGIIANGNSAQ